MSAAGYLAHPDILAAVVWRRVKRGRKWERKHGALTGGESMTFLISHGFAADGPVTPEMLRRAWAAAYLLDPDPPSNPNASRLAKEAWDEHVRTYTA